MSHRCPVTLPGGQQCPITLRNDKYLMDPAHWRLVPYELRAAVYAAWRGGDGLLSPELAAAQQAAATAVEAVLLERATHPQRNRRP